MSPIGKSGARSAGPMGWPVPGFSGGYGLTGRSGTMLYQARGIRSSSRMNFVRLGPVTTPIAPASCVTPWERPA